MAKGKSKPQREAKKPSKGKRQSVPTPTTPKAVEAAVEAETRAENARVRQAVHGSTWGGGAEEPKGVRIISGRPKEIIKRPNITSNTGKR